MDEKSPLLSVQVNGATRHEVSDQGKKDVNACNSEDTRKIYRKVSRSRHPFEHERSLHSSHGRPYDVNTSGMYYRYRYISKLHGHSTEMIIPDHMLPIELFLVLPQNSGKKTKQSSLVTIFAIWNTMMGTSLLSMPWALSQAGFGLGIAIMVLVAALCLYTCYLVVKSAESSVKNGQLVEFADICKERLGRSGEFVAVFFSVIAIVGAAIVFWVLMSNFLYNSGIFIHASLDNGFELSYNKSLNTSTNAKYVLCPVGPHSSSTSKSKIGMKGDTTVFQRVWSQRESVPFFLVIILFPLCCIKSPTFFTKFNSLGTLAVMYIIIFVIVKASFWGISLDFYAKEPVPLVRDQFPALIGTLSLAYFIHNCILSILRNQEHPENNGRDLSIAYILVMLSYMSVAVVFYAAFPLEKSCISQVLLDNIVPSDVMAFGARLGLLFQILTVYPLVAYIVRIQIMLYFFGKPYPGLKHVVVFNIVLIGICVIFAACYPHVGNIIRYTGALSGLTYIFTLPCIVHMISQHDKGKLTWTSAVGHSFIILLGVLNLISQFVIKAK